MEETQLRARRLLLSADLAASLASNWPSAVFELRLEEAVTRPGAPIEVHWEDGPTVSRLLSRLAPRWTGEDGSGYPLRCVRVPSPVTRAAILLAANTAGQLPALAALSRPEFAEAMSERFADLDLPSAVTSADWSAATLLAGIAANAVGRDSYTWAWWLAEGGGGGVLRDVLPAALRDH